jgi:outer membrane receptor protein involved in Fe transport
MTRASPFRSKYIDTPSSAADGNNTIYVGGNGRLDLSARYRFGKRLRLSFDVVNLTNKSVLRYYDITQRVFNFQMEGRILAVRLGYDY